VQDRLDSDYELIAEVISWFDLVAVQEVNDDLRGIHAIHDHLPSRYDLLFSDASGSRERQACRRLPLCPAQRPLLFGSDAPDDLDRRTLETFAVAWLAARTPRDAHSYVPEVVPLGDFNLPRAVPGDRIFDALVSLGLETPLHSSQIASAIASDNQFDQIAFFPGPTKDRFTGACNVFDFDGALFQDLWSTRTKAQFLSYVRYHISDHRPLWLELTTN
jgi:hypothetical protein